MLHPGTICLLLALRASACDAASAVSEVGPTPDGLRLASVELKPRKLPRPALVPATRDDDWGWVAMGAVGGAFLGAPAGAIVAAEHGAPALAAATALTSTVVGGVGGYLLGDLARKGSLFAKIGVISIDLVVSGTLLAILPLTLGQPNTRNVGQRVGI